MPANSDLVLRFSHNVVEHLGLKLYQNKPTNVIAETISNAWDADAAEVHVNMSMADDDRWIAVHDNGHGMSYEALTSSYLVIGHRRRSNADDKSANGRRLMGRKGIGKLAPFGIARRMDVLTSTCKEDTAQSYWLRFDLQELLEQHDGEYRPEVICSDVPLSALPSDQDETGQVEIWRDRLENEEKHGTLIIMSDLSVSRAIDDQQLIESLGRRFTVAYGHDFSIRVNGVETTLQNMLPEFDFRIPSTGHTTEHTSAGEVSFWVGFVKKADWPTDQAGVGVYAHGKIAQDRPFTFGVRGKEIFTRYMFGVVEAEWLDELSDDVISTDRTSINWSVPETEPLMEWGQGKVREWVSAFENWRRDQEKDENKTLVQRVTRSGASPRVTEPEEEQIVNLVSEITPALGKDDAEKERLVKAVSEAWIQTPMRRLVKDLWQSLGESGDIPPSTFTDLVERLSLHSVPESLNLAVVFAQRAFALTRLHDYVHHGTETDLQKLIESFPWIVDPDRAVLTANQQLKTAIEKAEELDQIPTGRRSNVGGVTEKKRPDFVFLSSPQDQQIVVVELKNPQEDLIIDNRSQLIDYMTWLEAHYRDAEISGYLIGRNPGNLESKFAGLKIVPWTTVLQRSRARNLELLAAMLVKSGSSVAVDARAADAIELGGTEARELLDKLAAEHPEISELINSYQVPSSQSHESATATDPPTPDATRE